MSSSEVELAIRRVVANSKNLQLNPSIVIALEEIANELVKIIETNETNR